MFCFDVWSETVFSPMFQRLLDGLQWKLRHTLKVEDEVMTRTSLWRDSPSFHTWSIPSICFSFSASMRLRPHSSAASVEFHHLKDEFKGFLNWPSGCGNERPFANSAFSYSVDEGLYCLYIHSLSSSCEYFCFTGKLVVPRAAAGRLEHVRASNTPLFICVFLQLSLF